MRRAALVGLLLSASSCSPAAPSGPPPASPNAPATSASADGERAGGPSDKKAEAQVHFRAGMKKIAAKDFDGGIAELEEAQRILPHPNVVFNIAKAHEDAGRKQEAIRRYREYLTNNPADVTEVEATIRRLEGR